MGKKGFFKVTCDCMPNRIKNYQHLKLLSTMCLPTNTIMALWQLTFMYLKYSSFSNVMNSQWSSLTTILWSL